MTTASVPRSAIALALCLVAAGCQKQDDSTSKESVRLLQKTRSAMSVTHRPGEAFIVLESDAVVYVADMEVLYFRADLKEKLAAFRAEWLTARRTQLADILAKNSAHQSRLKEIDEESDELLNKKATLQQDATSAVREAIVRLRPELQTLRNEQRATDAAFVEFTGIVEPFERAIAKAKASAHAITEEQRTLGAALTTSLNKAIVEQKLPIPEFSEMTPKKLFATSDDTMDSTFVPRGFVLLSTPMAGTRSWRKVVLADSIPFKLAGTPCEPIVRAAFVRWAKLEQDREAIEKEIARQVAAKGQALSPWSDRTNIPAWHIPVFLQERITRQSDIDALVDRLAGLENGSPEAKSIIETDAGRRTILIEAGLEGLERQRAYAIDTATKVAELEVRHIFQARFNELLAREAMGSVRTGSRGDFSIPADSAYLFAQRHRQNGESLVWLLRIDQKSPQIRLSNSNTIAAGANVDEFWMLTAVID